MEDLAVITALNHWGSFGMNFVSFQEKKIKMSFTSLTRSVLGKTVPEVVSTARGRRLGYNTYIFKWLIYPHSPQ